MSSLHAYSSFEEDSHLGYQESLGAMCIGFRVNVYWIMTKLLLFAAYSPTGRTELCMTVLSNSLTLSLLFSGNFFPPPDSEINNIINSLF